MNCFVDALAEEGDTQKTSMGIIMEILDFHQLSSDFISCDIYKKHSMTYASKFMTKISIKLSRQKFVFGLWFLTIKY